MAKYRGKNKGKTRDRYRLARLYYEEKDPEIAFDLYRKINSFLVDSGYGVGGEDVHEKEYTRRCSDYHVGGCSIGLLMFEHKKIPYSILQLRLVSNDEISDVVQRMTKRFPFFENVDPHNFC